MRPLRHAGFRPAAYKPSPLTLFFAALLLSAGACQAIPADRVGDVNGDGVITLKDAQLALRNALGLQALSEDQQGIAGLGQKHPTKASALSILRAALGTEALPWFCVEGAKYPQDTAQLSDGSFVFGDFYGRNVRHVLPDGTVSVYVKIDGLTNGVLALPSGHLLVAVADYSNVAGNKILDFSPDLTSSVLVKGSAQAKIGVPHQLALGPEGRVYFSSEPPVGNAFLLRPDGSVKQITQGIGFGSGIAVTPSHHLLVSDASAGKIWRYDLDASGEAGARKLWASLPGPGILSIDRAGRVWVAAGNKKIYVYDPEGALLRTFTVPGDRVLSAGLGPAGSHTIYATSSVGNAGCIDVLRIDPTDLLAQGLP